MQKIPNALDLPGLRPMEAKDVKQVHKLLNDYL
jgi:hypothetical protein